MDGYSWLEYAKDLFQSELLMIIWWSASLQTRREWNSFAVILWHWRIVWVHRQNNFLVQFVLGDTQEMWWVPARIWLIIIYVMNSQRLQEMDWGKDEWWTDLFTNLHFYNGLLHTCGSYRKISGILTGGQWAMPTPSATPVSWKFPLL